jgi:hypothetical protein
VPAKISKFSQQLLNISEIVTGAYKQIAFAFIDNLESVLRTVSIPLHYTLTQVQSLHYQRLLMVERIEALRIVPCDSIPKKEKKDLDSETSEKANERFREFAQSEGCNIIAEEALERLLSIMNDSDSLAAARELTRQGVLLIWGAFEVLARDLFVELLNRQPTFAERLLSNPSNRKRFGIDKIDWITLNSYGFDLSRNVGTILSQRADLDDVPTIKDAFNAIFPTASDLAIQLSDHRLWILFQKRNLIVHRRGVVDQQYIEKTGEAQLLGSKLMVTPSEIEDYLSVTTSAGYALLIEVNKAV